MVKIHVEIKRLIMKGEEILLGKEIKGFVKETKFQKYAFFYTNIGYLSHKYHKTILRNKVYRTYEIHFLYLKP